MVDLSEPMDKDTDTNINNETPIKTVKFSNALYCLETVKTYLMHTGRPRVTMPNEDRYLAVIAKRNRRITASNLSRQLSSVTGTTVSKQTVYIRLGQIVLYARRPVRCRREELFLVPELTCMFRVQIKDELDSVYGDSAPPFTTVKFWSTEFKRGRKSLGDDERSGRPNTVAIDENIAKVRQMVLDDR
ncbi:HTH_48 domain-containing protein [Trichonephila clavipes]|nr:HTH_48 domain-containing protein [Trichonephila clavipes]